MQTRKNEPGNNAKKERIAITGLGLITSVGQDSASSISAIKGNVGNFKAHESVLVGTRELHGATVARVSGGSIHPGLTGTDRALALLVPAIKECIADVCSDLLVKAHCSLENFVTPATDDFIAGLKEKLPELAVTQKKEAQGSLGRCSFFENIIQAAADLRQGKIRMAVVGCVDSLCALPTLEHLNETGKLKSAENPEGIIPGEAAGAVLLERESDAKKRKAAAYAYIRSDGRGLEPNPWTANKPSQAKGLTDAFREALQQLPNKGAELNAAIVDLNGERARSLEWGLAASRIFRSSAARELHHPADCVGDCGAAMGAVLLALGATSASSVVLSTSDDAGARRVICLEMADDATRKDLCTSTKKAIALPAIIEQHAEELSFLWLLRDRYVCAPNITLPELIKHDKRINANLDALRIAGDAGWEICQKEFKYQDAGECFAAAVLAFESNEESRIQLVLDKSAAVYKLSRGIVSALGWLAYEKAELHIKRLLASPFPEYRRIGIAASAIHRKDPGDSLTKALADNDSYLRARALKAAGELGRTDLVFEIERSVTHPDERCRFWSAWSLALLGDAKGLPLLKKIAVSSKEYQDKAVRIAFRTMSVRDGLQWRSELAEKPETSRLAIIGAGVIGDSSLLPWLIEQMHMPVLSRVAGEAFSMITGVDLSLVGLEGKEPLGFEYGPNDDPDDHNVKMDADEGLAWPNAVAIKTWWDKQKKEFKSGTRYFLGKPISSEHLQSVLRSGYQRQREAAATALAVMKPGRPLYDVRTSRQSKN